MQCVQWRVIYASDGRLNRKYISLQTFPEMIRAMNYVINQGWCLYWGTAKWSHVEVTISRLAFSTRLRFQCCRCFHRSWKRTVIAVNLTASPRLSSRRNTTCSIVKKLNFICLSSTTRLVLDWWLGVLCRCHCRKIVRGFCSARKVRWRTKAKVIPGRKMNLTKR